MLSGFGEVLGRVPGHLGAGGWGMFGTCLEAFRDHFGMLFKQCVGHAPVVRKHVVFAYDQLNSYNKDNSRRMWYIFRVIFL